VKTKHFNILPMTFFSLRKLLQQQHGCHNQSWISTVIYSKNLMSVGRSCQTRSQFYHLIIIMEGYFKLSYIFGTNFTNALAQSTNAKSNNVLHNQFHQQNCTLLLQPKLLKVKTTLRLYTLRQCCSIFF